MGDPTNPVTFDGSCYRFDLRAIEQIVKENGITKSGARERLRCQFQPDHSRVNQPEESGNQDIRTEQEAAQYNQTKIEPIQNEESKSVWAQRQGADKDEKRPFRPDPFGCGCIADSTYFRSNLIVCQGSY